MIIITFARTYPGRPSLPLASVRIHYQPQYLAIGEKSLTGTRDRSSGRRRPAHL